MKTLTIPIDDETYDRLRRAAEKRGQLSPPELAKVPLPPRPAAFSFTVDEMAAVALLTGLAELEKQLHPRAEVGSPGT